METFMPIWLANLLRILLIAALPVCLVLTNVRLMLTPFYINWEYNLKDFPPDLYGFTKEDRLKYSAIALEYLLNDEGINFLGDLTLPADKLANADSGNRMYNDRELKHMVDVKIVVKGAMLVWVVAGLLVIGSALALAWQPATRPLLRSGLLVGSGITIGVLVALVAYIAIGFNTFFVQFHQVFFQGDSWLFRFSDTLIRLFPVKFWFDVFLWVGGGALVEAVVIGAAAWWGLRGK
jgi:integral membrane protein (TIGR01906 family)